MPGGQASGYTNSQGYGGGNTPGGKRSWNDGSVKGSGGGGGSWSGSGGHYNSGGHDGRNELSMLKNGLIGAMGGLTMVNLIMAFISLLMAAGGANKVDEIAQGHWADALEMCGNNGQRVLITDLFNAYQETASDVYEAAMEDEETNAVDGIMEACPHPEAVEQIIMDTGEAMTEEILELAEQDKANQMHNSEEAE